jgi:PBP1b-binding outer membrane lipoprotein LpoB
MKTKFKKIIAFCALAAIFTSCSKSSADETATAVSVPVTFTINGKSFTGTFIAGTNKTGCTSKQAALIESANKKQSISIINFNPAGGNFGEFLSLNACEMKLLANDTENGVTDLYNTGDGVNNIGGQITVSGKKYTLNCRCKSTGDPFSANYYQVTATWTIN